MRRPEPVVPDAPGQPATAWGRTFTDVDALNRVSDVVTVLARDRTAFDAELRSVRLGALAVDHVRSSPFTAARTPGRIARRPCRMIQIGAVRSGALRVQQDGRRDDVAAGQGALLRGTAEYRVMCRAPVDVVQAWVPVQAVGPLVHLLPDLTARTLPPTPLAAVTLGMIEQLALMPPQPDTAAAVSVEHALTDLVTALVGEFAGLRTPAEAPAAGTRMRVRDYVLSHLTQPDLGPTLIASNINVSVRCLHRLFESENTTVAAFVRTARLSEAARRLTDPGSRHLGVGQIARMYGFGGSSQFTRSFRSRYGVSPSEMRRGADAPRGPEAHRSGDRPPGSARFTGFERVRVGAGART